MMRRKRLGLLIFFILPFALLTVSCDNDSEKESGNSPVAKLKVTTENENSAEIVVNKSTNKELNFTIKMPELSFNEIKTEKYGTFLKINENGFSLTDGGEENFSYPQRHILLYHMEKRVMRKFKLLL